MFIVNIIMWQKGDNMENDLLLAAKKILKNVAPPHTPDDDIWAVDGEDLKRLKKAVDKYEK